MSQFETQPETAAAVHAKIAAERATRRQPRRPLTDRLADAMLEITGTGHVVDFQSLALRGFLRTELTDDNIAVARDKANARAVRQVA